jgi:hypothetical protein
MPNLRQQREVQELITARIIHLELLALPLFEISCSVIQFLQRNQN